MQLSDDQRAALEQLYEYVKQPVAYITLGGYAGVGKTTLLGMFRNLLNKNNPKLKVAFCSFTGRAVRVLHTKLKTVSALYPKDSVSTIHSLIYSPIINSSNRVTGWKLKDALKFDLIIVDEASMVGKKIWEDLLSFQVPIIAVGDHGQLPPIESGFNLMQSPEIRLEKIHRQAQDNPIIKVSLLARENGYIPARHFGSGVMKVDRTDSVSQEMVESALSRYTSELLVLCGYNRTRTQLNAAIRGFMGFESQLPMKGDRVICLKNNQKKNIFNGMLGTVYSIHKKDEHWYESDVMMDDDGLYTGLLYRSQFGSHEQAHHLNPSLAREGDFFDFGYALTVHKSQGGQARQVVMFEERFAKMDDTMWRRWLYTAVTRAEEELLIVGDVKP